MAIIYMNIPGLAFEATEDADAIREDLREIGKHNDSWADLKMDSPEDTIDWIEITSLRQAKTPEEQQRANEQGQIEVPLHIRVETIVAVGA